jgi:hypothetical protein
LLFVLLLEAVAEGAGPILRAATATIALREDAGPVVVGGGDGAGVPKGEVGGSGFVGAIWVARSLETSWERFQVRR